MKNIKQIFKAAFVLIAGFIVLAAKPVKTDFNGSWQLDTAKSEFGEKTYQTAAAVKMLISATDTDVTFERVFHNVPAPSKEALKLDGSEFEIKQTDFAVKRILRLSEDKLTLTVNSKYHMTREAEEPWDYTRTETYALAKDGNSMLLTRISVTPGGTETVKAFYNRVK